MSARRIDTRREHRAAAAESLEVATEYREMGEATDAQFWQIDALVHAVLALSAQ